MKKGFIATLVVLAAIPAAHAQIDTIANKSLMVTNPSVFPFGIDIDVNYTTTFAREYAITYKDSLKYLSMGAFGNGSALTYDYIGGNTTSTTAAGSPWMAFFPNGNIAIGSTSTNDKLDVNGSMFVHGSASGLFIGEDPTNSYSTKLNSIKPSPLNNRVIRFDCSTAVANGGWEFYNSSASQSLMVVQQGGNVGIGTINPQSLLAVAGTVTAKGVTVTLNNWSDFVFDSAYRPMPLSAVAKYTSENKHLPDIPSAADIEKNGLDLGDMQKRQMQKIEELTLYAVEADKRATRAEALLEQMQTRLEALQAKVDSLTAHR